MKTFGISLLVTLSLIGLFGVMPAFHFLQNQARSEMKARIKKGVPDAELHVIRFDSEANIDWVREGKEFRKDGKLYDVVKKTTANCQLSTENSSITFYCIDDHQETQLFSHLDELCNQQKDHNGNPVQDFVKAFAKSLPTTHHLLLPNSELQTPNHELLEQELSGFTHEFFSPPEMI